MSYILLSVGVCLKVSGQITLVFIAFLESKRLFDEEVSNPRLFDGLFDGFVQQQITVVFIVFSAVCSFPV